MSYEMLRIVMIASPSSIDIRIADSKQRGEALKQLQNAEKEQAYKSFRLVMLALSFCIKED